MGHMSMDVYIYVSYNKSTVKETDRPPARKENAMMNYNNPDLVEIARIFTFATSNRRDIVRRLMGSCESFKRLAFPDALAQFCYYERAGLVEVGDGWLAIYHNAA